MVIKIIIGFLIIVFGLIGLRKLTWPTNPYPQQQAASDTIPQFNTVDVDFVHQFNNEKSLPFMGAAIFNLEGNDEQYLFVGGGYNQEDKLFKFSSGQFIDVSAKAGLQKPANDTTYGVVAVDANRDGLPDLFVARDSGIYYYENQQGKFKISKLDIPLDHRYSPISIATADLQKKGLVDLYVAAYIKPAFVEGQTIFNKKDYGAKSLLLKNNGDNTFTDVTDSAGLNYIHNTFQGVFVDLDGDNELDLVVAHDTGQVRTYKNLGNMRFQYMPNPTSGLYSYPMGIAVGDYNNDGLPDLFFSNIGPSYWWNIGSTPPGFIVRGDLRKDQTLLRDNIFLANKGNFQFEDVAKQTMTADYEFGWGVIFQDFTNDGTQDLVIAQNYIGYPLHKLFRLPGRLLKELPDQTYASIEKQAHAEDPYYAISPLSTDFTGNGYPDLVYTNLNGPLKVFLNTKGGGNNYVKVQLPYAPEALGAVIKLKFKNGKVLTRFFVPTQGLCAYQGNQITLGLGKETEVDQLSIHYMNGTDKVIDNPVINSIVRP
ncbi:protein containing FG-GAP repeats (motif found in alpha integrins) [Legionella birminghamensis]|uniref:Protein containing FG-GAP repeats (Motif found in alpha integrins) n=1 Tax=Legionella birminghamensis TaxID=28083 RepID=A0A378ICW1_9GAMM|nr:VCBS repeat-containing protein [Legionella birminghamensis]KTC75445.1 protein containing FG-GAP repeats (motif found in alpha integrins) [Legionella birminghamensis]STX32670.1 protein containing FG-GAP repeats (motif found in alpha integrins) [Legionella birminghamensis]